MTALAPILDRFTGARLIVVGDVMLDRYEVGEIARISPEAPVPVLRRTGGQAMLGGAGNVAANLASLGASVALFGMIGADAAGLQVTDLCTASGIDAHLLTGRGPTTTKTRFVSAGQQVLRVDEEDGAAIGAELEGVLLRDAVPALDGTVLLLSDYAKGLLGGRLAPQLIEAARAAGARIVVDPKGRDMARYAGADLVTPNLRELADAAGRPLAGEGDLVAAASDLATRHRLGAVLVTRSEQGMSLVSADAVHHITAQAREVYDVSGAGDTVAAVLALGLAAGLPALEAARIANVAAGLVVAKRGTARLSPAELRDGLSEAGLLERPVRPPLGRDEAAALAARWRTEGLRVGFTNGCFDIVHYGHVSILERARARCDRLIVGLNDDASVARLKGPQRPVNPVADRAAVLAGLRAVDAVAVFAEDTPLALIEAIAPDLLVKGADYTEDQVVGAAFVRAHGGEVILLPLEDGRSTTGTIARLKG